MLKLAELEPISCILDSNGYSWDRYGRYDLLAGVGAHCVVEKPQSASFTAVRRLYREQKDWLFGFWSYELKNDVEELTSSNFDGTGAPPLFFFVPKTVFTLRGNTLEISCLPSTDPESIWRQLQDCATTGPGNCLPSDFELKSRISREEYLSAVKAIQDHIIAGDCYELNYCIEHYVEDIGLNPACLFADLNRISKAPFSCYFKANNLHIMSASPERFLQKHGDTLISQPIKGTISRAESSGLDQMQRRRLRGDEKELAENVMITDLVRNDLARSAETGSVVVEELFGVYSFEKVHHLISTISAKLRKDLDGIDAIKHAFPMGSMTGAPKVKTMELIERYEASRRGVYSGSLGYISPDGDFDFNVVIRSLIYAADKRYLSFQVGGAITHDSMPEKEYEECLLKARNILQALGAS